MSIRSAALLALASALILSGAVSASASAHAFFVEGKEVAGTETVEIEVSGIVLKQGLSTLLGEKIGQECAESDLTGQLEKEGKGKGEIKTGSCKLFLVSAGKKETLTSCEISSPTFKVNESLFTGPGGVVETEIAPSAGETFFILTIKNASEKTCVLKGTYEVKGKYVCASPEAEVEKITHEVICTSTGSKATFGKEPATFFSTGTGKVKSGKASRAE